MSRTSLYFSPDFATARRRFRDAVSARGGRLDSLQVAGTTPHGEDLSIDIGWFGAPAPRRVLVHSSGLHGVEGYAGSAIQLQWLADGLPAMREDAAVVLVHMLNPYGAAWLRRVNENNVDLNRNFRAPDAYRGEEDREYAALDALLNPPSRPGRDFFYARAAWLLSHHGMARLRQSVVGGQTVNPRGLFYAGAKLEAGPAAFQSYLRPGSRKRSGSSRSMCIPAWVITARTRCSWTRRASARARMNACGNFSVSACSPTTR